MQKNVNEWVQSYGDYQRSKVHRHLKIPLGIFSFSDANFAHIHTVLIGYLPQSD